MKSTNLKIYIVSLFLFNACGPNFDGKTVKKASNPIVIDGYHNESTWNDAEWYDINNLWLGDAFTKDDFEGRYKLTWDEQALYLLVEITDDTLVNNFSNPLERWWDEDCVEIFIDEDNSGGDHQFNHNAFAYHVDLEGNVVDIIAKDTPKLFNNHVISKRVTVDNTSVWEFKILLFNDSFTYNNFDAMVNPSANKKIGFALAYCDNDNSEHRENFIGSVFVEGPDRNRGWKDAGIFETILLVD